MESCEGGADMVRLAFVSIALRRRYCIYYLIKALEKLLQPILDVFMGAALVSTGLEIAGIHNRGIMHVRAKTVLGSRDRNLPPPAMLSLPGGLRVPTAQVSRNALIKHCLSFPWHERIGHTTSAQWTVSLARTAYNGDH